VAIEKIFDIYAWDKLIHEIEKLDDLLIMRTKVVIDDFTVSKEAINFLKNNLEEIFPYCKDTDFMRIKKLWLEIKDPKIQNTEKIYLSQIHNIVKILNATAKEKRQ